MDAGRGESHPNFHHPHGTKRRADDDLETSQRLTKRFHLLSLRPTVRTHDPYDRLAWTADSNGKLWIPPRGLESNADQQYANSREDRSDLMEVEDTKDRVYIRDLDEELGDVAKEDVGERIVFLPDIERRLNNLPKKLLAGDQSLEATGNELVLYNVPSSLSVPLEQDSVRKVILETRARAQHQQETESPAASSRGSMLHEDAQHGMAVEQGSPKRDPDHDEDAMDIG